MKATALKSLETRLETIREQMKGSKRVGFRRGKWGEEAVYSDGSVVTFNETLRGGGNFLFSGNIGEAFEIMAKLEGLTPSKFLKAVIKRWTGKRKAERLAKKRMAA